MPKKLTRKDLPQGEDNSQLESEMDQRDQFHKLRVLKESEGGKELISLTIVTIINTMRHLAVSDKDPLSATLKANLDLLDLLNGAKENEDHANELITEALS